MPANNLKKIYLKNYKKPNFLVPKTNLTFNIEELKTTVTCTLEINRDEESFLKGEPVLLNGDEDLKLLVVSIDGVEIPTKSFKIEENSLYVTSDKKNFVLQTRVEIDPSSNKSCMGLYKSKSLYCTQMEPEGFRKVTFFPDKPDVLSKFTTTIIADKEKYPTLLSNGNLISETEIAGGRKKVIWEDPFPKPSCLFALIAGDLGLISDSFVTKSGKKVLLEVYSDKGNEDLCWHAMNSLKKSMKWDEDRFNLEYDLDRFMIVAVDDFNFGGMENKGLNIFNSSVTLVSPETATDRTYFRVEAIVAHEYFHNWTGNRIACRDWFQLTLKEGLTVLRDQEFSSDLHSRSVCRIDNVDYVRSIQFKEDASPNAHPIRPESFTSIDNFYTPTVYRKGSEVIRMILSMYGESAFQAGMKKYFELYDGQSVRTEDFLHAMELGTGKDLTQFKNWYSQAGTPRVKVTSSYNEESQVFTLKLEQSCPATPGQIKKKPFVIPLKIALLSEEGKELSFICEKISENSIIELRQKNEEFSFKNVLSKPILSINRNFTAPVIIEEDLSLEKRIKHLCVENDPVNRYIAGQNLLTEELLKIIKGKKNDFSEEIIEAFGKCLYSDIKDYSLIARYIELPSISTVVSTLSTINFEKVKESIVSFCKKFALFHSEKLFEIYQELNKELDYEYQWVEKDVAKRELKNRVLFYLICSEKHEYIELGYKQAQTANNFTDTYSALSSLANSNSQLFDKASKDFYEKYRSENLVIQKWFALIASRNQPSVLEDIKRIEKLKEFLNDRPNHISLLYKTFSMNPIYFNKEDGSGYKFFADKIIEIAKFNPNVAAVFIKQFNYYSKLNSSRQALIKAELERIKASVRDMKNSSLIIEVIDNTLS